MKKDFKDGAYSRPLISKISDWVYEFKRTLFKNKKSQGTKSRGGRISAITFLVVMMSIPLLNWIVFFWGVNINSFWMAFSGADNKWNAFENFRMFWNQLIDANSGIGRGIRNTFLYFRLTFITIPTGLIISYFFFKKIFMYKSFRLFYYLPGAMPTIVMVSLFKELIKPWGPVGLLLARIGIAAPTGGFLGNEATATSTIITYCLWMGLSGNYMLIGAAMARIPTEVLESAKLEGCSAMRELVSIVLPLVWPTLSTLLIFAFTGIFVSSGPILMFTQGAFGTTTLSYWIFARVLDGGTSGHYGLVSATGLVFTLAGLPIILFTKWLIERVPVYEY